MRVFKSFTQVSISEVRRSEGNGFQTDIWQVNHNFERLFTDNLTCHHHALIEQWELIFTSTDTQTWAEYRQIALEQKSWHLLIHEGAPVVRLATIESFEKNIILEMLS